jgi:hypothetical protein
MYCAFFLTSISGTRHTSRKKNFVYKEGRKEQKKKNSERKKATTEQRSVTSTSGMSKAAASLVIYIVFQPVFFFSY